MGADPELLYKFLSRHRYGVLSSTGPLGSPQSALVGIAVTAQLEIIFDAVSSSRKYANLKAHPACSFVVGGWSSEQTAQYEGYAVEPSGPMLDRYREIYFADWPQCRAHLEWPDIVHFVVTPRWIRYSDFDARPPSVVEWTPSPLTLC